MKQLRPAGFVLAALALCTWSASSHACDQMKSKASATTAQSAEASCSDKAAKTTYHAKMAAHSAKSGAACTAEMMAACAGAKGAKAAKNVTAANSVPDCCAAKGASTTTASVKGSAKHPAVLAGFDDHCAGKSAKNTAVLAGAGCASHGAKTTAVVAGSGAACGPHGTKTSMTAGKAESCGGKGMIWASGQSAHGTGCDACADMNACDQSLRELGAAMQAVPLKNGVMFVYTTDAAKARLVQRAMSQRKDQMALFASSSNKSQLCGDCRHMRGAAMSGKLIREVVNIEGGCLSLITSSDPAIVAKIHSLAGMSSMARAKI